MTLSLDAKQKLISLIGQAINAMLERTKSSTYFCIIILDDPKENGPRSPAGKLYAASAIGSNMEGDLLPLVLRKIADSIEEEEVQRETGRMS